MNIRLKAGLEVAGFGVSVVAIAILARLALDYLSNLYGSETVIKGLIFSLTVGGMITLIGIIYDIRVAQLKYKNKLLEMTQK